MKQKRKRHRLQIDLDEDLYFRMLKAFEHGERQPFFHTIIADCVAAVERHGKSIIGGVLKKEISVRYITREIDNGSDE